MEGVSFAVPRHTGHAPASNGDNSRVVRAATNDARLAKWSPYSATRYRQAGADKSALEGGRDKGPARQRAVKGPAIY